MYMKIFTLCVWVTLLYDSTFSTQSSLQVTYENHIEKFFLDPVKKNFAFIQIYFYGFKKSFYRKKLF